MIKLVKGEIKALYNCELGISLLNDILYISHEDYKTIEIKPTKDRTNGGLEKQISKAIPHLMKLFSLGLCCEIIQSIMNMIEHRELGHWGEDFNLRLVYDWHKEDEKYTLQGWW